MSEPTLNSGDLLDPFSPPYVEEEPYQFDLPPDYDGSDDVEETLPSVSGDLPPAYPVNLPNTFPIGAHDTQPLVKLTEVEAHLRLLGAFWQLRQDVINSPGTGPSWARLAESERWHIFVCRAVWRFELWYTHLICRPGRDDRALNKNEVPPLDVAMVWHAYFLNPLEYLEEGLVRAKRLLKLANFPLGRIASSINPITMRPLDPAQDQTFTFEAFTGQPFLVSSTVESSEIISVPCPRCKQLSDTPWYSDDGKGFGQLGFRQACKSCSFEFGKEAMGVRRLAEHIRSWLIKDPPGDWLAGTVLDYATGLPDFKKSYFFNRKLLRYFETVCKEDAQKSAAAIGDAVKWSTAQAEYCIRVGMRIVDDSPSPPRFGRMLSHYNHAGLFSLDLVGATIRQGSFIKEMSELGWTGAAAFASDKTVLARSIARYHAWLDLFASNPSLNPVPTLDIDLIWHTHMLFAQRYRADTRGLLDRIPNHDDKVEENALADAFDETARAWRTRFGIPYSVCGCVLATNESAIEKLNRLKTIGRRGSNTSRIISVDAKALVGDADGEIDAQATHPSEHYAVLVIDNPSVEHARHRRADLLRKAQDEMRKTAAKSKAVTAPAGRPRTGSAEPRTAHMQAYRRARPGPQEQRRAIYDAFLVNGKELGAGQCAVGISGGICQINGSAVFCAMAGRCVAAGGYGMMSRGGMSTKLF